MVDPDLTATSAAESRSWQHRTLPGRATSAAVAPMCMCFVVLITGCGSSSQPKTAAQSQPKMAAQVLTPVNKRGRCDKKGLRYTGTTAQGIAICFTLTANAKNYLEIGYRSIGTSSCAKPAAEYIAGPLDMSSPGYLEVSGSTAGSPSLTIAIRGAQASGIIHSSDFCGGKKATWNARATEPLAPQALRNLKPAPLCRKAGIRYLGKTAEGDKVCFTLRADARVIVESAWKFVRAGGCPDAAGTSMREDDRQTMDPRGHLVETDFGLSGTIRGADASGMLEDALSCPGKVLKWTARATQPLSALAVQNLKNVLKCKQPGTHYAAKTSDGALCFTVSPDGNSVVEVGWSYLRVPSNCPDVTPGEMFVDVIDAKLDASGHFDDGGEYGLSGTIHSLGSPLSTATGKLADSFLCAKGETLLWSAHPVLS